MQNKENELDREARVPEYLRGTDSGQPPSDPAHRPIDYRLVSLAAYARRNGQMLTYLTFISAIITLIGFGALGIVLARGFVDGSINNNLIPPELGIRSTVITVEMAILLGAIGYLFACTIAALLYSLGLYEKYFSQTTRELHQGEYGLIIASEDLWKKLTVRLETGFFRQAAKVPYRGLERHLLLCVAHWNSLGQISAGKKFSGYWLKRGQQDFNQLNMFYKPSWWYLALMVFFGILFFFQILMIAPIMFVVSGSRYTIFYARLTALAEFYLGEQTA